MEFLMMMKLKNQEVVQRIDYPILLYILIFLFFIFSTNYVPSDEETMSE